MTSPSRKTLAEHLEYVAKMPRWSFFFARKLKDKNPETPVGELERGRHEVLITPTNCNPRPVVHAAGAAKRSN